MRPNETYLLHLIDELKVGGAQTHLLSLLRAARPYGYRHKVAVLFGTGPIAKEIRSLGIEVVEFDFRSHLQKRNYWGFVKQLAIFIRTENPTAVEAHLTWSRLFGLFAAAMAKIPKRYGFEQGDLYHNSLKWRLMNFFGQFLCHKIIVCSHWLKHWVHTTHHVSAQRLAVFHNAIDPSLFARLKRPPTRKSLSLPSRGKLILAVGSLGSGINKRMDVVLKGFALAKKKDKTLALLICGDGEFKAQLKQLAKQLKVHKDVYFLGNRRDIAAILAHSTFFCHAAPREPFGIVGVEALAAGVAVLIPNSGGIQEISPHKEAAWHYRAEDPQALAEGLLALQKDKILLKRMQKNGPKIVKRHFNIHAYAKALYQLYGLPTPLTTPKKLTRRR